MTEDQVHDDDELNFDDEEFIVEDSGGGEEDIFAEVDLQKSSGTPASAGSQGDQPGDEDLLDVEDDPGDFVIEEEGLDISSSPEVEDILFEALGERGEKSHFNANLGDSFAEGENRDTGEIEQYALDEMLGLDAGAGDENADQIEEDDGLFAIEDEDIELIDGDVATQEFESAPTGLNRYGDLSEESESELFITEDDEEEAEYDPIYGAQESAEEPVAAGSYAHGGESSDYSVYEEDYIDEHADEEAQLLGGGQGRRFPFRALASLAAVLIVAAAGAVVFLKPEWVGLKVGVQPIEIVKVARPDSDGGLVPPRIPPVATTDPGPIAPPDVIDNPPVIDPDPLEIPVVDPIEIRPDPRPVPDVLANALPELRGPLQVGESLSIGLAERMTGIEPRVSGKKINLAALQPGSEAYAQLPNEAYFVGTVRRLNVSHVTMTIDGGEVTFAYDELMTLTSLAEAGIALSQGRKARQGYIRLENQNRLYGMVLQPDGREHVVLEADHSRVRIDKEAIDKIGVAVKGGVDIPSQGDDEWLREQVQQRMQRDRGQPQRLQPGVIRPRPGKK